MAKDDFMEFDETKFDPGHITEQNLTKEMLDVFFQQICDCSKEC